MDIEKELKTAVDEYQRIVNEVKALEENKNVLINKGVKLEGRIILLQEQLADSSKPTVNPT